MLDKLSRLVSANANLPQDLNHSELNMLFAYTDTLVKLSHSLLIQSIHGYGIDEWWNKILTQIDNNDRLLENKAILSFEEGDEPATSDDLYYSLKLHLDILEPVSGLV